MDKLVCAFHCTSIPLQKASVAASLVVQWIRLHAPNAGGLGSIPGQGTRAHMHAATKRLHAATKGLVNHS